MNIFNSLKVCICILPFDSTKLAYFGLNLNIVTYDVVYTHKTVCVVLHRFRFKEGILAGGALAPDSRDG